MNKSTICVVNCNEVSGERRLSVAHISTPIACIAYCWSSCNASGPKVDNGFPPGDG